MKLILHVSLLRDKDMLFAIDRTIDGLERVVLRRDFRAIKERW